MRFGQRVVLIFTGQQRLARTVLINALRRGALMPLPPVLAEQGEEQEEEEAEARERVSTVTRLSSEAAAAFARLNALLSSPPLTAGGEGEGEEEERKAADDAVDLVAGALGSYWRLKKDMAAGTELPHIQRLLASLAPCAQAMSLCGAGGGGFAVVVVKRELVPWTDADVGEEGGRGGRRGAVETLQRLVKEGEGMTVHSVSVDSTGLRSRVLDAGERCLSSIEVLRLALSRSET
jgi:hypothetical protein